MKINLIKALKLKNRIASNLQKVRNQISNDNRYIDKFDFNVLELLDNNEILMQNLIELKTKINKANSPIQSKIFELSELKAWSNTLNGVAVKSGTQVTRFEEPVNWKVQVSAKEKEKLLNQIQKKINFIQDELDSFNSKHFIDISFDSDLIEFWAPNK